jgi:hypothetical protein
VSLCCLAAAIGPGCEVDPYCLFCPPADDGGPDAGDADAAPDGGDAGHDADQDFECNPDAEEVCNGRDDDCDDEVDEGFDLSSDPRNCGACGVACNLPNAFNGCVDGECVIERCDACFHDLDPDEPGCEYACCVRDTIEVPGACEGEGADCCDGLDNDCDGETDEDHDTSVDPGNCGGCAASCEGADCPFRCDFPYGVAGCEEGRCVMVDCVEGRYDIDPDEPGCEYSCTPNRETDEDEVCNGRDDDCNGIEDDDVPGLGLPCGGGEGACVAGVTACVDGREVCAGEVLPTEEVCDDVDNDCDGRNNESFPEDGRPCGTNIGECRRGTYACIDEELTCVGSVGPRDEECNGRDDDCDGIIDDEVPDAGSCGIETGECVAGRLTCESGAFVCTGGTGPVAETCNGLDDDCDGEVDEDFDLTTDPRNCGRCGNDCLEAFPHAVVRCARRTCELVVCQSGWYDIDPAEPGCEYPCTFRGREECNGRDDDCNGEVDDWTPPERFCGVYGVCAGVAVRCVDPDGDGPELASPLCDYPATYQATEDLCDGRDNDCDGRTDEGYDVGRSFTCDNGLLGRCLARGYMECAPGGHATRCHIEGAVADGLDEICNDVDDDCDGEVDEGITLANSNVVEVLADVDFDGDGRIAFDEDNRRFWIFQYEASHPDATRSSPGSVWSYACSQAPDPDGDYDPSLEHEDGVLPWSALSWRDAQDACCGRNDDGDCAFQTAHSSAGSVVVPEGWALCTAPDWMVACRGPTSLDYPYGADYDPDACNGFDNDSDPGAPGNQSFAVPGGSMDTCAGGGGAWPAEHFDMSGNVHEWTATGWYTCSCDTRSGRCDTGCTCDRDCACACDRDRGTVGSRCQYSCACDPDCNTFYEYRGGSFENPGGALSCGFDFNVGEDRSDGVDGSGRTVEPDPGLTLESLGFRCCFYPPL